MKSAPSGIFRSAFASLGLASVALLSACGKPAEPVEVVRPVRAVRLASPTVDEGTWYSGEVRPRVESRLGFRVAGKIVRRVVDVGATVKAGQVLAALDPRDLQLQNASAEAQLAATRTDVATADADLRRHRELQGQGFISGALLEQKQNAAAAAHSRYDQAIANLRVQGNQAGYATLVADADGVVTGVDAEVGQVVTIGQSVVRVAQTRERELAVAVPEQVVASLAPGSPASLALWSRPGTRLEGKVREIAPAADAATRTYAVRVAIPAAPDFVLIGMTGSVRFGDGAVGRRPPVAPLSALFRASGAGKERSSQQSASLWVIDPQTLRVRAVDVTLGAPVGNSVTIEDGARAGDWIVTAGVNLLKADQRVSILADAVSGTPSGTIPVAGAPVPKS